MRRVRSRSVTFSTALVPHAPTDLEKRGSILRGAERQEQYSCSPLDSKNAVRADVVIKPTELLATCAGNDLGHPPHCIRHPVGIHRAKTLVIVIVAVENEIDIVVVE